MQISHIRQLTRIALGFHNYLKRPLTFEQAINDIKLRMDNRERNFLSLTKRVIYENQHSPYRKLLLWAGCDYGDLECNVRHKGLEKTLEILRDEGVYLTLEEFKSKIPVCRRGLTIETHETDFDNPFLMGKAIAASTSGSRSEGTRVMYDWEFITEEAANELVLYEIHGVSDTPLAFWLPGLPAISGIHNILMNIKFSRPPEKWFSHLNSNISLKNRMGLRYINRLCRLYGLLIPQPEFISLKESYKVAEWMEGINKKRGKSVVRTYASSAIRVVQSAIDKGMDISGGTFFTGGEPLTELRSNFMNKAGVKTFPRYVATEAGLIGASCPQRSSIDDMHIYMDRLAVIQNEKTAESHKIKSFLFTSLLPSTGKVLLNTEIGDFGDLFIKKCDCLFGRLGMIQHVSNVRSFDKLTGEGMTLLGSDIDDIVGELVMNAGGNPDDYQFWESEGEDGLNRLTVVISPEIKGIDEKVFIDTLLKRLSEKNQGTNITSQIWQQAGTLKIIRAYPEISRGFKMLPIVKV